MWSYIARRLLLMIPTLFGVTVVSFCIMQLAPGDPLLNQLGPGGMTSQTGQTREAFLIQKRDLKLDKPLVLNFNHFRDYRDPVRLAADYLTLSEVETAAELARLAEPKGDPLPDATQRLAFLRSLAVPEFDKRLAEPAERPRLAVAVKALLQPFCEDEGLYAVPAAVELLSDDSTPRRLRVGLVRCLNYMVPDPFVYTYSRDPQEAETPRVVAPWRLWWEDNQKKYPPLEPDVRQELEARFATLVAEPSRQKLFEELEYLDPEQMRFFAEKLLGATALREKFVASLALRFHVRDPLRLDVGADADDALLDRTARNWLAHYQLNAEQYEPGFWRRAWSVVADTQYAHMLVRLATFNFGRSALKTRELVSEKIWAAVIVSAPLMVMAELVIYGVSVPLGILCAVGRRGWTDRLISVGLFLLYSVPPFVAGMLLLLFFCYGDYLKWFPTMGLHSEGAEHWGLARYLADYFWHAALPVLCLSLFSLAGLAMYSRTAMLDVLGQDYVRTARAKGVPEWKVILKHALRNALIPIITLFSSFLPAMLGGSVIIEVLFGIPGMGRLGWQSIEQKDFPTLMALIYIDAIVVMLSILLTDLLYVLVDPRISFEGQGKTA